MIVLGLGTNQGDRIENLKEALRLIATCEGIEYLKASPVYESKALLPTEAPNTWNQNYLNMAVACQTKLSPTEVLTRIKDLEKKLGRESAARWAPRKIDIDLLAYDALAIQSGNLTIPHPGLLDRAFALLPLTDVMPFWVHPTAHAMATDLAKKLKDIPDKLETRLYREVATQIVGILNITPDSFSDGGQNLDPAVAIASAEKIIQEGATIIDVGAESTRPGAKAITAEEEWLRLKPVLNGIRNFKARVSVDTRHGSTAKKSLELGIGIINDVSGCDDPEMLSILRQSKASLVFMHHFGIPPKATQTIPPPEDPVTFLCNWGRALKDRIKTFEISESRLILDPGLGFGKTPEQNMAIIARAAEFKRLGLKTLFGHSRKSFLAGLSPAKNHARDRDPESAQISALLAEGGVDMVRVHNVAMTLKALKLSAQTHGVYL